MVREQLGDVVEAGDVDHDEILIFFGGRSRCCLRPPFSLGFAVFHYCANIYYSTMTKNIFI